MKALVSVEGAPWRPLQEAALPLGAVPRLRAALFETFVARDGAVLALRLHLVRLRESVAALHGAEAASPLERAFELLQPRLAELPPGRWRLRWSWLPGEGAPRWWLRAEPCSPAADGGGAPELVAREPGPSHPALAEVLPFKWWSRPLWQQLERGLGEGRQAALLHDGELLEASRAALLAVEVAGGRARLRVPDPRAPRLPSVTGWILERLAEEEGIAVLPGLRPSGRWVALLAANAALGVWPVARLFVADVDGTLRDRWSAPAEPPAAVERLLGAFARLREEALARGGRLPWAGAEAAFAARVRGLQALAGAAT